MAANENTVAKTEIPCRGPLWAVPDDQVEHRSWMTLHRGKAAVSPLLPNAAYRMNVGFCCPDRLAKWQVASIVVKVDFDARGVGGEC